MALDEILMVMFSGLVAVSTIVYAFLTWKLVSETQRMRKVHTEPRLSIRVELDHTGHRGYELLIGNEGQGVAKNVRFEFKGDSSYFRKSFVFGSLPPVDQLPVVRDGLDFLESGQMLRFPLGTVSPEEYDRAIEAPWTFHVQYENLYGKTGESVYTVDFSQFRGMVFEPNRLKEIAEHLESISKDISKLTKR